MRRRSTSFAAAALALLAAGAPALVGVAAAATHMVSDFGDTGADGQLRGLIDAAAPGDTIVIPAGTIAFLGAPGEDGNARGDLDIHTNLTIAGAGVGSTILAARDSDRVLEIHPGATVTLSGMTIQNGRDPDDYGGGIANRGTLVLGDVSITGNRRGGGLANFGTASLTDVSVRDNAAAGSGGGIYNTGTLTLERATISANSAGNAGLRSGGGIFSLGPLTLTNVTITANSAADDGGGIVQLEARALLINVTIADNTAGGAGAGLFNATTTMELRNVIIANRAGANCAGSGPVSLGHNLDSDSSCALTDPSDLSNAEPGLGPLQPNGGPTETQALLPGSPAIDAGDDTACPHTDQRGAPRPADGTGDGSVACDIGAHEVQPACAGDCGGDLRVTIDDLVVMVNVALGSLDAAACRTGDVTGDGEITVDEILVAVNAGLNGCLAG